MAKKSCLLSLAVGSALLVLATNAEITPDFESPLEVLAEPLPDLQGRWTATTISGEAFSLRRHQPWNEPAAPPFSSYAKHCGNTRRECGHCRVSSTHSYETTQLEEIRMTCDDGLTALVHKDGLGMGAITLEEINTKTLFKMSKEQKPLRSSNASSIHTVHMIYMNHYDVGYTGFVNDVDNTYMHTYFKLAANTSRVMRKTPDKFKDKFIYTTHAWLMQRFLECPCGSENVTDFELTGIYTGPSGVDRYVMSGLSESEYVVRCLTSNFLEKGHPTCGWSKGMCTLAGRTVTCKLDNKVTIKGAYNKATGLLDFDQPWRKFLGDLSGLWYGPSDTQDYYIFTHNSSSGAVTVWWDQGVSNPIWTYGQGMLSAGSIVMNLTGWSQPVISGTVAQDFQSITWDKAGVWHKHTQQCYVGDCVTACPARSLNNPFTNALQCPTKAEVDDFTQAAKVGDIVWHAAPFNIQPENMAPELFDAGIDLVRRMDRKFYGETKNTTTMSIRDVIYVTRSIIPRLAKHGITGLTIGSNGADVPPQVPKLHRWVDKATDTDVVVAYHPYGYGGYGLNDCAESPNGFALCTEFRVDNTGPPNGTAEVLQSLDKVRAEYPNAQVKTSTFDAFMKDVLPVKDQLPVIDLEVGDTWMYGTPSDPLKIAQNRALQRIWIECMKKGMAECSPSNPVIQNYTWALMKAPEHTWGTPGISGWGGGNDYNVTKFRAQINTTAYTRAAASWAEQRFFNELAVRALEESKHPLAPEARAAVDELSNVKAPTIGSDYTPVSAGTSITSQSGISLTLGTDGSIVDLSFKGTAWASASAPWAKYVYKTYNETEWKPFTYAYLNSKKEDSGFCKPGSNNFTESNNWSPTLKTAWVMGGPKSAKSVVAHLTMPTKPSTVYGAPKELYINISFPMMGDKGEGAEIDISLITLGKLPTMIGESSSFVFNPAPALKPLGPDASAWAISKTGGTIDPEGVQDGGNQFNHASFNGLTVSTTAGDLKIKSLDAANFNPVTPDFPFGCALPASYNPMVSKAGKGLSRLARGSVKAMAVNLHNNLWNTNYPLYYPYYDPIYCSGPLDCKDANLMYRFSLTIM